MTTANNETATQRQPVTCCRCRREPAQIPVCVETARQFKVTPETFVIENDGTYNPTTRLYACDGCYIALGQPAGRYARWRADRVYGEHEKPGTGPRGVIGSSLRAFQEAARDFAEED